MIEGEVHTRIIDKRERTKSEHDAKMRWLAMLEGMDPEDPSYEVYRVATEAAEKISPDTLRYEKWSRPFESLDKYGSNSVLFLVPRLEPFDIQAAKALLRYNISDINTLASQPDDFYQGWHGVNGRHIRDRLSALRDSARETLEEGDRIDFSE